jgi:hypothetical protein
VFFVIYFSSDRFKLPRDENEKRIFEKNLSRDENRLLGDFFYLIYVFGGNLYDNRQVQRVSRLITSKINNLRKNFSITFHTIFDHANLFCPYF